MATICFDYDGVLTDERMQKLAIKLRREKNELWIVTARSERQFNRNVLKSVLHKLFLDEYHVIFCEGKPKWELIRGVNADIYIDNISDEFENIKNHTNTIPLLFT